MVRLDEDADRVAAVGRGELAGRRAGPAFELVTDHPGAAADVAFGDGAGRRLVEGTDRVLRRHVKAVDVVQVPVVGLGDHRVRVVLVEEALGNLPPDDRVPHDADAVRVRDEDRSFEEPGLVEPVGAGHLAVAVQREPAAEDRNPGGGLAARKDRGDTGSHGGRLAVGAARVADQRDHPDLHARDVRECVLRPGKSVEGDSEVARARLLGEEGSHREQEKDGEGQFPHATSLRSNRGCFGVKRQRTPVEVGGIGTPAYSSTVGAKS